MYDYKMCLKEISELARKFNTVRVYEVGRSVMDKPIYCIKSGQGDRKIFINGAHHGMEYLTSAMIMCFLREYETALREDRKLFGYDVSLLYKNATVYAVPMVNPDGVNLAVHGLNPANSYHRRLFRLTGPARFRNRWQANANGVDLNHNYDAGWRPVKKYPCASKYAGERPESEPETQSITALVRREKFDALAAFHSQGGEIYYTFDGKEASAAQEIAEKLSAASGYAVGIPSGSASFGGLKDWYIKEFGGIGFTVEIGRGRNPLPIGMLESVSMENIPLILCLMSEICDKNSYNT